MVRITIDDELKQKLLAAEGEIELCDSNGVVIRRVVSTLPGEFEQAFPELTPEEIERRCSDPTPGLSTAEVKRRLLERDAE